MAKTVPDRLDRWLGRLLLYSMLMVAGLYVSSARADPTEAQVAALVEALRLAAPSGPKSGLYSDWQIKPNNIRRWSKRCAGEELTPTEFELSPMMAREILECIMGEVLREQYAASGEEIPGVRRAAAWWLTGEPNRYDDPSIDSYIQRVTGLYRQQRHPAQRSAAAASPPAKAPPAFPLQSTLRPVANTTRSPAASSPVTDVQVAALVEALRLAAPRGVHGDLHSEWQVKADNIHRWSKRCIGQEITAAAFEADPDIARRILSCVMRDVLSEQYRASGNDELTAVRRAAAWWMTGDPERYDDDSFASYTQEVLDFYIIRKKIDAG